MARTIYIIYLHIQTCVQYKKIYKIVKSIKTYSSYTFGARIAPQQQTRFCENFRDEIWVLFRIVPDAMCYSHTISHRSFIPTCSKSISFYSFPCSASVHGDDSPQSCTFHQPRKTSTTPPDVHHHCPSSFSR